MVLYHASKIENRENILKNGILVNMHPSGYGKEPKYTAVYLFSEYNKTVIYDLMFLWREFDVYKINSNKLDLKKLIADEDSGCYNWIDSLCLRGTVAYLDNINFKDIQYDRCVSYNEECSYV